MQTRLLLFLILCFFPLTLVAQEDIEGSKDYPLFSRMPNFFIYYYDDKEFDQAIFNVEVKGKQAEFKPLSVEGKKYVIGYLLKEGTRPIPSRLQIIRNYVNAAKRAGGTVMLDGTKLQNWTNVEDGGMLAMEEITLKFGKTGGEIWVGLTFDNAYLNPDVAYVLTIVEKEEMRQDIVASDEMLRILNSLGRIALYINFDTGKSEVKSESMPVIDEIETLLKSNSDLKISIEGHTDNVGNAAANKKLSEARAQSVMKLLVTRGIDQSRLSAKGLGQEKPLDDNSTEEGRARNRRVELVKQ